jgi:murein DD-endopeptidase MepM/ murein hydrolase activator NlpD
MGTRCALGLLLLALVWPGEVVAACGDVNLDSSVDAADVERYRQYLADPIGSRLSPGGMRQCHLYGVPRPCDVLDVVALRRALGGLDPVLGDACNDADGDGVDDPNDPCPGTPEGARALASEPGCWSLDVVLRPERLLDPAHELLQEASALLSSPELQDNPAVSDLVASLNAWSAEFELGEQSLRSGDPCAGASLWSSGASLLRAEHTALAPELPAIVAYVLSQLPPSDPNHFGDGHLGQLALDLGFDTLDRGIAAAERAAEALQDTCSAVADPVAVSGRVVSSDDRLQLVELDSGQRFALPESSQISKFSVGMDVNINAIGMSDGSGILGDLTPVDPGSPDDLQPGCLFLRVAPVQGLPPFHYGPTTLHRLAAYELASGVHVLERHARFAALSTGCPNTTPGPSPWTRYSMELAFEYPYGLPDAQQTRLPIAPDLDAGDGPVALPLSMPSDTDAELVVEVRKQTCLLTPLPGPTCGPFTSVRTESYPVSLRQTGSLCEAQYYATEFDMEDNDYNSFRWAWALSVDVDGSVVEPGTSPAFQGETCIAVPGATSCSNGQIVTTNQGQPFRIYNHDFWGIHGVTDPLKAMFMAARYGVRKASGVSWPRVRGTRNGSAYHYRCGLPDVVRDVVDWCWLDLEHSYYRYPFYPGGVGGPGNWYMGNGNSDQNPGHGGLQIFAFDWGADANATIRAVRGGRVALMREDSNLQDTACWDAFWPFLDDCIDFLVSGGATGPQARAACVNLWQQPYANGRLCDPGNYLYIRHQDGTFATYFHMVENGVLVDHGDIVHRSDDVGEVGTTGNSTGNHLHFHVQQTSGIDTSYSIRIRFQNLNEICMIPQNGDQALSSNDPPAFY